MMIVLILIAILLYLFLWGTGLFYLIQMRNMEDGDKKLQLTYNCLGAVSLEQVIALVCVTVFYAVRLNDVDIDVPDIAAIISAVVMVIRFVVTGYFWLVYRRKHFPEYVKKGKIEKKAIALNHIITVGMGVSVMNFAFNLMLAGAISYLS